MPTIKAIETHYAGCRFRSRLEARWAVFFDHMGIRWEYEPQGYLIDGRPYLPDFWLPEHETWIEVKGAASDIDYDEMLANFAEATGHPIVMFTGPIPAPENLRGRRGRTEEQCTGEVFYPDGWDNLQRWWICWWCGKPYVAYGFSDGHMRCPHRASHDYGSFNIENDDRYRCYRDDADAYLDHCLEVARSARFEHGEHG